jgi:cell wall-associated NlpC family hydrolase
MSETESWFNSPERVALLEFKAAKWLGTPWFPNSNTVGKGVSCQKLVSAIYREVGFADVPVQEVRMSARGLKRSLVEEFMEGRHEFHKLARTEELKAGDLLGFRSYEVVHHLGIVMTSSPDGAASLFVHVIFKGRVMFSSLNDAIYKSGLQAVWRPRA